MMTMTNRQMQSHGNCTHGPLCRVIYKENSLDVGQVFI